MCFSVPFARPALGFVSLFLRLNAGLAVCALTTCNRAHFIHVLVVLLAILVQRSVFHSAIVAFSLVLRWLHDWDNAWRVYDKSNKQSGMQPELSHIASQLECSGSQGLDKL